MKWEIIGRLIFGALLILLVCGNVWADWSEPVLLSELNVPGGDEAVCSSLSSDGLTMYFVRHIPAYGYYCIVEAHRSAPVGPFTSERILSELRVTGDHVSTPWISDDELRLYYFETVLGVYTIKMAQRSATTESWTPVKTFDELHTGGYHGSIPSLSGDELTIIWTSSVKPGAAGSSDMWMATRTSTDTPFGDIRPLWELNTSQWEAAPCLLSDGLTLYFCSIDRDGDSGFNIYRATRSSTSETFGNVQLVQLPDTQSVEEKFPFVTSDEETLFYSVVGQGIFATHWSEPPAPPVADANGPYTLYAGDTLTLDASGSTDEDGTIISHMWDLDDDGVFETDAGIQAVFDVSYEYIESLGLLIGVDYNIHLKVIDGDEQGDADTTTLTIEPKPALVIAVDIKPASCPNPLNVKSKGVLSVAILGSESFDATTVDATSIRLKGVPPVRHSFEDVAAPALDVADCNCIEDGPDGFVDLTLKFETQQIVEALDEVEDGDVITLELTGVGFGEIPIEGADCIVIRGRRKPFNNGDINKDGVVNMLDFIMMSEDWLKSSVVDD